MTKKEAEAAGAVFGTFHDVEREFDDDGNVVSEREVSRPYVELHGTEIVLDED